MDLATTVSILLLLLLGLCNAQQGSDDAADDETSVVEPAGEDMTSTILRMNNGSNEALFEGDLILPRTRNAMKCLNKMYSCLWPKSANGVVEIPYVLSHKYDNAEKTAIVSAMMDFKSTTCIRFIPRGTQRMYVSIEPRYGCSSSLGHLGDKQRVSLQRFGCIHHGIIQHELLHTLGFYHEHTRRDRDEHLAVNWENVNKDFIYNFKKKDSDSLNTPYDYSSVMHYGRNAFSMTGAQTLTPIPDPSVPIGQREGMSDIDILRINKLYKCWHYTG